MPGGTVAVGVKARCARGRVGPRVIESLHSHRHGSEFETDLCVIGSGPAGLALARQFLRGNNRVLVVESGGEEPEADAQTLNRGHVTGRPYDALETGRRRGFGGTSWIWTGQCLPLGPEAFVERPWAPRTRWPMEWEELTPYYDRATEFFGLEPHHWREDMRSAFGIPALPLDPSLLGKRGAVLTDELRFGPKYIPEFRGAPHLAALVNATVVGLHLSPAADAITGVDVATLDGRRAHVRAKAFVLAAGALENTRLLLLCPGLGDRLPALGRYFQDHPAGVCAQVEPKDRLELQNLFAVCHGRGARYSLRLRLADEAQKRAEVVACESTVVWAQPPGVVALYRLAARGRRPGTVASDLRTVLRDRKEVLSAARRYRRGLNAATRDVPLSLLIVCEQVPNPDSRLTLADEPDALGLPRISVDWRLGEIEHRAMVTMADAVTVEFKRLGLGVVHREEWLDQLDGWKSEIRDTWHPAGSTRMGADATDSVVDSHGRVHGLDNAFVVGSSTFPGVGAANPTLTIVAMALRLAERLKTSVFS
jgi:choline dehydrogenase-like flavoprotein